MSEVDFIADHSLTAISVDTFTAAWVGTDYFGRPHIPMNLDLVMASHSWDQPGLDEIIVYDLGVTNIGYNTIHDAYVGVYVDADVCFDCNGPYQGFADDVAGSVPEHQIGYIIDNDGDFVPTGYPYAPTPKVFALKWLHSSFEATDTSFNWWVSNSNSALDFGPRMIGSPTDPFRDFATGGLGTPEGDVNKYYLLRHSEWDYDQIYTASIPLDDSLWLYPNQDIAHYISEGYDARFLLSMGPFDLPPGATERVLFAAFTADSVHVDSTNGGNLPYDPDTYLANLNFDNVFANAVVADSLGQLVMSTLYPVTGLKVSAQTDSTVTVRWQRAAFQNVDGYNIYLSEVPPELLPYPGIPAPWLEPDELVLVALVPPTQLEYTFESLDPGSIYFVNVASVADGVVGNTGKTIFIRSGSTVYQRPLISAEYLFIQESQSAIIEWSAPQGVTVDHYHLYRGDSAWASTKYYPFYDEGGAADSITPIDSFYIADEGITYYYYAMEPWVEVDALDTSFVDPAPNDNDVYFVNAVDEFGFETPFSDQMQLHYIEPRTKDILVVIGRQHLLSGVTIPSLVAFYDSLLFGYDYDFYFHGDSVHYEHCPDGDLLCFDWHDFMRYQLVLIDDGLQRTVLEPEYEDPVKGYTRYLLSGGQLAIFGPIQKFLGVSRPTAPGVYPADHWFVDRFFGIDSMAYMGIGHCAGDIDCHQYTGFQWAESIVGSMPDLAFNPNAPFSRFVELIWPCGQCAPDVASFKVNATAEVTHRAHTLFPTTSLLEAEPIGLRTEVEGTETWLFGFHLWYMDLAPARQLIEAIIQPQVKTTIEPDTVYGYWAHAIDPQPLSVYLGQFPEGLSAADVAPATLIVNSTVTPSNWTILASHPNYVGEVLELEIPVAPFVDSYGPVWGISARQYQVTGQFLIKCDSLSASGTVVMSGHLPGDVSADGMLDISDLIYLVDYMFRDGAAPRYPPAADVDANCSLDIGDIIYLVDFYFADGAPPRPGCAAE